MDILLTISVTITDNQVNGKFAEVENKQAPVAAVIETAAEKGGDDDGEVGWRNVFSPQLFHVCSVFLMLLCPKVFYIFYENEETLDKGVKSGLDLQRYIHEEVLKLKYHHHHCHHHHHHHQFIFNIIINLMKFRLELDQQTLNTQRAFLKVKSLPLLLSPT